MDGFAETRVPPPCDSMEVCMQDMTEPEGILEPCVNEDGQVPPYQRCLWNVIGSGPTGHIEILLTPKDFGNFPNRSLILEVGYGYKDDFPAGNDETILATFETPVWENVLVTVDGEDAWVHLLTRRTINPIQVFYSNENRNGVPPLLSFEVILLVSADQYEFGVPNDKGAEILSRQGHS
ncbi:unnamed protein product [Darwinula stevensoni]|uniref:Uncharacterized protein n=1 Tax=Darwinula stevensoni TaxID=69355 RepID=A0A7R8XEJ2_9CRUS|nr:unnamed protein product [Darwinula stevensoni]CAG0889747.1 unnamed protein product [Darwinula stevensoni]